MGLATHHSDPISATINRLLEKPDRLNALSLWRALDEGERAVAARDALERDNLQDQLVGVVADARKFRAITVRKWPHSRIVEAMRTAPLRDGATALVLLRAHLECGLRELSADFRDVADQSDDLAGVTEEAVRIAADRLVAKHGVRPTLVCLLVLALVHRALVAPLRAWWRDFASGAEPSESASAEEPDDARNADPDGSAGSDPTHQPSFTTLDRILLRSVEDARQGVVGALDEDEIDDAVDEFLQLNGSRHRSCFHVGYRDALFGRELQGQQHAHDASRMRWYWAGAMQGWARSESWSRIAKAYDENPTVRQLGDGEDPASTSAVEHIVRALRQEGRAAELQSFVEERAIVSSRSPLRFCQLLLDIGTDSLRAGDAAEARAILELLLRVAGTLPESGTPRHASMILQARRRRAHCLRQLGEHLAARNLLLDLLERDPAPNVRAMVHADLGLLEGHFTLLADVRLPDEAKDIADIAERLVKGEEHFRAAVERKVAYAAHGCYCLGVLALAREEYGPAGDFLEQARAHFRSRPENYPTAVIAQADLYLGIARAHSESAERLSSASTLIVAGLEAGAPFPRKLLASTVEVLGLGTDTSLAEVAARMLAVGDDTTIDVLAGSDALNSWPPLADALLERACRSNRPSERAAADLRGASSRYLRAGDCEAAGRVLDQLERLAVKGIGVEDFLALLSEPERYEPAWSREAAAIVRARCYESRGEYDNAINELRTIFFRYSTRAVAEGGSDSALDEAAGVLAIIRGYGLDRAYYEDLERRYDAVALDGDGGAEASGALSDRQRVRVLVVGGDVKQEKMDDAIRARVRQRDENIDITFLHSGWSSSWDKFVDGVRRRLERHHAVVISHQIRTGLGEHARRECGERNIPWRSCWGQSQGETVEAVLEAARAGRAARDRCA